MGRHVYLLIASAVTVMAAIAVVVAVRTDPATIGGTVDASNLPVLAGTVPSLDPAAGWINSEPLSRDDLDDKVVVYDFWTYSCVNCVRTLPHLRAWYDRYRADGLVIVGVHSPEFEFEKVHENVERAVGELGVTWPVALDDGMAIWDAFGNRYWPAKYVADRNGQLRYVHFGEGAYDETEDVLRSLLGVGANAARADDPDAADAGDDLAASDITPETYLGSRRGETVSPEGSLEDGERNFTVPDPVERDRFALDGLWLVAGEYVAAREPGAAIVLAYHASEVNLVMSAPGDGVVVEIELDGQPLPPDARPDGVTEDADGRTVVTVGPADLYRLVLGGPSGDHVLRLTARAEGLQAYAFTFGTS